MGMVIFSKNIFNMLKYDKRVSLVWSYMYIEKEICNLMSNILFLKAYVATKIFQF